MADYNPVTAEYNPILIAPKGANKKRKRVGRGSSSGHGTTAGRGNKGQQSRSGKRLPYVGFEGGQMPLYRRIARRGFSNAPFAEEVAAFNLRDILPKYNEGETVNRETLIQKKLLPRKSKACIKILSMGDIDKKIDFKVDRVSKAAKEKIEKAGGTVEGNVGPSRKERRAARAQERIEAKERSAKAAAPKAK